MFNLEKYRLKRVKIGISIFKILYYVEIIFNLLSIATKDQKPAPVGESCKDLDLGSVW